jgi:predicted transcriptional regulator of viral defense system
MKSIDALTRLNDLAAPAFTTNDASAAWQLNRAHASKMLERLARARQVVPLRRGLWAFPDKLNRLLLPSYLTAPSPCYVSLQSALYLHGLISQMPQTLYVVSPSRTRLYQTPLGAVSVHHIKPSYFTGYETDSRTGAALATPEKALADLLYLMPARSHLFASLPELELSKSFRKPSLLRYLRSIDSPRRQTMALRQWNRLLEQSRSTMT